MLSRIISKKLSSNARRFSSLDDAVKASSAAKQLPHNFMIANVTFADEDDARIKIQLPKVGPVWLCVDKNITFDGLIQNIVNEDPSVENHQFFDSNFGPIVHTNSLKIFDALTDPSFKFYLKLNDCLFGFDAPTIDVNKEAAKFKKVSKFNDLNSPRMVESIKQAVQSIFEGSDQHVANAATNIQRSLAQQKIELLNEKRTLIVKRIEDLQAIKDSVDRRAKFKTNMLFRSFFTLCFAEFLAGYYCIYEVSWLGWDLVEPLTYSLAQFKFTLGTWFYCKYLSDTGANDLDSFFCNRFRNKMFKKLKFENDRLEYLKEQLQNLDSEVQNLEKSSF